MVRIVDSDAINKRVFADIANTFQHSQKITGENTVQNLSGVNDPKAAAMDNFNFNGIEFSKIKQLINIVQAHKKEFFFDEQLVEITNNKEDNLNYFETNYEDPDDPDSVKTQNNVDISKKGVVINDYKKQFVVPDSFDGRNCFAIPFFVILPKTTDIKYSGKFGNENIDPAYPAIGQTEEIYTYLGAGGHTWDYCNMYDFFVVPPISENEHEIVGEPEEHTPIFYRPNLLKSMRFGLTEKRNIFDHKEFIKCWAASMDSSDGNNCMIIDKSKEKIVITASLNLANKNAGFDRDGLNNGNKNEMDNRCNQMNVADFMRDNCISRVYLYVIFVYWRDK